MIKGLALAALAATAAGQFDPNSIGPGNGPSNHGGLTDQIDWGIVEVTCDVNNGDRYDSPYNLVVTVSGADAGHHVGLVMTGISGGDGEDFDEFTDGTMMCPEWEGHIEFIGSQYMGRTPVPIQGVATDSGYAKFRIPTDACDTATGGGDMYMLVVKPMLEDNYSTGFCNVAQLAYMGNFIGAEIVIELPRFDGEIDSKFEEIVLDWAFHSLLTNDEHGMYRHDDLDIYVQPNFQYVSQFINLQTGPVMSQGAPDSVYVHILIPATDGAMAMEQIHHVRKLFMPDGDKEGYGRRDNTNGSDRLEKDLLEYFRKANRDPSFGHVFLRDSQISRDLDQFDF